MFAQINHIGMLVTNLDKARHFYGIILGFTEIPRPKFLTAGIWYDLGTFQLHLMLYEKNKQPHFHPLNETVQMHFALELSSYDFNETVNSLQENQIPFITPPASSQVNHDQVFFYDFDGNMLEICNTK